MPSPPDSKPDLAAGVSVLTARSATGSELRVAFRRQGDRWEHVLETNGARGDVLLASSMEGTPDDDWPPSPPLQSLSLETLPDGRSVALCVGMAGTSHWSLSVEPVADAAALIFDVACRVDRAAEWLGSTYELAGDADDDCPLRFTPLELAPNQTTQFNLTREWATVTPGSLATTGRATLRWKYRVEFVPKTRK